MNAACWFLTAAINIFSVIVIWLTFRLRGRVIILSSLLLAAVINTSSVIVIWLARQSKSNAMPYDTRHSLNDCFSFSGLVV